MITGRTYLERGQPVVVLTQWGPGGGPRNVRIRRPDGTTVVRPFRRRRRATPVHRPHQPRRQPTRRVTPQVDTAIRFLIAIGRAVERAAGRRAPYEPVGETP